MTTYPNKLYNLARMTTATTGTGTITLGSAVSGFLTFAAAGVQDGTIVSYGIRDGSNSEAGIGTYASSGTTLTRTVITSTNSNSAINLSGSAEVYVTALASDLPRPAQSVLINGSIVESHATNAATFAVKDFAGNDPSVSSPVFVAMADGTEVALTAALSLTVSSGSTLGTTSGNPFRLWFAIVNDSGTARLAVRNCSDANGCYAFPGNGLLSSIAEGGAGGADNAGVTYTGTAVSSKQYAIVGFAEYDSGLVTAGTWNASPSRIQLFNSSIKKPGDLLQAKFADNGALAFNGGASLAPTANRIIGFIPNSLFSNLKITGGADFLIATQGEVGIGYLYRNGTTVIGMTNYQTGALTNARGTMMHHAYDRPYSGSTNTYEFWWQRIVGSGIVQYGSTDAWIMIEEFAG